MLCEYKVTRVRYVYPALHAKTQTLVRAYAARRAEMQRLLHAAVTQEPERRAYEQRQAVESQIPSILHPGSLRARLLSKFSESITGRPRRHRRPALLRVPNGEHVHLLPRLAQ